MPNVVRRTAPASMRQPESAHGNPTYDARTASYG